MIRRSFRWGLFLGLLGGVAATLMKVLQSKREPLPEPVVFTPTPVPEPAPARGPEPVADEPLPAPTPVKKSAPKAKAKPKAATTPWVEPVEGGCPDSHPVKAKLSSGIFHLPGGFAYPRTRPDRCYIDAAAAESDGLRPAKR